MEAVEVLVPGGFDFEGDWRRNVWLRPWDGADAECLGNVLNEAASPAVRTTAILSRFLSLDGSTPATTEFVRKLSAGDREALLLHLQRISVGNRLDCVLACPSCAQEMDLELRVDDLLVPAYGWERATHSRVISGDGRDYEVCFRLPNGADQETVAALALRDVPAAAHAVLERCVEQVDGEEVDRVPPRVAQDLPELLAELDPQADLILRAVCPECQTDFDALFDSAAFVHQELGRAWKRIHREVHVLALHYHWSEADIVAMSDSKRRLYLELLGEAPDRGRVS